MLIKSKKALKKQLGPPVRKFHWLGKTLHSCRYDQGIPEFNDLLQYQQDEFAPPPACDFRIHQQGLAVILFYDFSKYYWPLPFERLHHISFKKYDVLQENPDKMFRPKPYMPFVGPLGKLLSAGPSGIKEKEQAYTTIHYEDHEGQNFPAGFIVNLDEAIILQNKFQKHLPLKYIANENL